jgi:hypothetical protein
MSGKTGPGAEILAVFSYTYISEQEKERLSQARLLLADGYPPFFNHNAQRLKTLTYVKI